MKKMVLCLASVPIILVVAFILSIMSRDRGEWGVEDITVAKNESGYTVVVDYSGTSKYSVEMVDEDYEICVGERYEKLGTDIGKYCLLITMYDTNECDEFAEKYSPRKCYTIYDESVSGGDTVKFKYAYRDHALEIFVGFDKPIQFTEKKSEELLMPIGQLPVKVGIR